MKQKRTEWKQVKGCWISSQPVLPGVWQRKEGGHVVRARAKDGATGHLKEIWRSMPEADAATALKWLEEERTRIRAGLVSDAPQRTRFADFATSLFERKVSSREIKSAKGRQKWADILRHLIAGTTGRKSGRHVDGFGEVFLDKITIAHVETWRAGIARLVAAGDYAPTTANGWLAVLRVVMKAAKRGHQLAVLATDGVEDFDESEHDTYTEDEPNALLPSEVGPFLAKLRELHPAHFAMVYLGLVTGLRPSTLRPLRRRGSEADVLWDDGRILVRRSHTVGEEVMRTTKQRRRYAIDLPKDAMTVLRWHVETQLATPDQRDSDLLFPSVTGGFRSPTVLNKPLADVAAELDMGKHVSQSALRRTFNDLARAAQVSDVVTRSISGHLTERMQHHYSTVNRDEQREALARVVRLVDRRPAVLGGEDGGEGRPAGGEDTKKAG